MPLKSQFGGGSGNPPPATPVFELTVEGQPAKIAGIGIKRRVVYAPLVRRDLRVATEFYLRLALPISLPPATPRVEVRVPSPADGKSPVTLATTFDPRRISPAIHVNQEGYVPSLP